MKSVVRKLSAVTLVLFLMGSVPSVADCSIIDEVIIVSDGFRVKYGNLSEEEIFKAAKAGGTTATRMIAAMELQFALEKVVSVKAVASSAKQKACSYEIQLVKDETLGDQAFKFEETPSGIIIKGNDVGVLYGVYHLLDHIGFKWYAPDALWNVVPSRIHRPTGLPPVVVYPNILFRGARTDDGATVPDTYLLWMARNRFNVIGVSGVDPQLASAFAIKLEGGGHNLISQILAGERIIEGRRLDQIHPEWYAGARRPIDKGSDFYDNPCLAAEGMAEFFAADLAHRISAGDLLSADIISIWPSDQTTLSIPASCKKPWLGATDVDQLFYFYGRVSRSLDAILKDRNIGRQIVLSGASYYDTWQPPDARALVELRSSSAVKFLQVLYLNERTFSTPLALKGGSNERIVNAMRAWVTRLHDTGVMVGVCEYYNYSIYNALPATFASTLGEDFQSFVNLGIQFISYMHPIGGDPGPRRLMEALRARLPWGQNPSDIKRDYFQFLFGAASADVQSAYMHLDRATGNLAEMWGSVGGLVQLIAQNVYWSKPPLSNREVLDSIPLYFRGGEVSFPKVRPTTFAPLQSTFLGLEESQDEFALAIKLLPQSGPSEVIDKRIKSDYGWIKFGALQYEILYLLAQARMRGLSEEEGRDLLAQPLKSLKHFDHFGNLLSPLDQRRLFAGTVETLISSLKEPRK